ncbi:MAG: choice-of-anchor C family protein [Candidatus Eremiobacteraeota bacterium]|nr:choice-of-anchor C family protein [Candidatus Eremiobacteraeota bacterium]
MKFPKALSALFVLLLSAAQHAAAQSVPQSANLVVNGSFESGNLAQSWIPLYSGSAAILGWQVHGAVDYVGAYWRASDGSRSLDLDGTPGPGGVAQTLRTVPGQWYAVRFDLAGNPEGPPRVKLLGVSVGRQMFRFAFDVSGHSREAMGWLTESFIFRAATPQTTLQFYSLDEPGNWNGPVLDDVRVGPANQRGTVKRPPLQIPPVMRAPKPTAQPKFDLNGLWSGIHRGQPLRVNIRQGGGRVVATLVPGYGFVPAGNGSWSQLCSPGTRVIHEPNSVSITIESLNSISVQVIGCPSDVIRLSR